MTFLKDTTLATITWNSVQNSAGGIELYVDSHAPYVEEVLIYDTGSTDGTLDVLEKLQNRHSNLEIMTTTESKGFATWRNDLIENTKTGAILMLDDDELITPENIKLLHAYINHYSSRYILGLNLDWQTHHPYDEKGTKTINVFPKFFYINRTEQKPFFIKNVGECLVFNHQAWESIDGTLMPCIPVTIEHFVPEAQGVVDKYSKLYMPNMLYNRYSGFFERPSFDETKSWKEYNPKRELFK
ncbi:glycosyltransferase [Candidatus Woesearchaeota archaeon]|nr:glycosyltransferase [Candidatus Woesearchaeota archaeon]